MRFIFVSITIFASLHAFASHPLSVLIDPGHGGKDRGTVRGPTTESSITLAVSRHLFELLKKDRRFAPKITRESDLTVSLGERARLSKLKKAQVFVSIHVNSSPDKKARGAEFYFQNQLPPDEESMFLAHQENLAEAGEVTQPLTYEFLEGASYPNEVNSILGDLLDGDRILRSSNLSKALKLSWRGSKKSKTNSIRQAPFYVLSQMRTPSTLVELGFLTNEDDFRDLTNPVMQKRMAEDLYRGLVAYLSGTPSSTPSATKDSLDKAP